MLARTSVAAAALVVRDAVWRGCQRTRAIPASTASKTSACPTSQTSAKVDPHVATEDVNRRNADGSTPLQWAVYEGDVAEVRRLLRAGADVSLANNYGATPMSLAAEVGNTDMLKLLLEVGANADSPNPDGQTALHGGGENGQRGRRTAVAGPRRHRRCARKVGRTDRADVGVGAPASGDDAAADLQGRRRQCPLDRSRLSASCDGRGASQEPGQRWIDAAALCRARELHGVRGRAAQERRGHRPAGSGWRLAAARGDHECQLGSGEATDRGRRRRQSVGHLSEKRRCSRRSTCATGSTADAHRSIR